MQRIVTVLFLVFFSGLSYGQFYFNPTEFDTAAGMQSQFDLETHTYFVNKGTDTLFTWVRKDLVKPAIWGSAVCDNVTCYDTGVSTSGFILRQNDSFEMIGHFYPFNTCGYGSFNLEVYRNNVPNDKVMIEYAGRAWCLGVNTAKANELKVYPNPASSHVDVEFGSFDPHTVSVYDISGRQVRTAVTSSLRHRFNISDLPEGMYMIKVQSNESSFTRTFIKN